MDDQSKHHARFLILYHVIYVRKYRKKLLVSYGSAVKQVFEEIAARSDFSGCHARSGSRSYSLPGEKRTANLATGYRAESETRISHSALAKIRAKSLKSISGRKGRCGVMALSAAPVEMQAKKPFASTLKVKGEARRSSTRLKTSWFSRRAW